MAVVLFAGFDAALDASVQQARRCLYRPAARAHNHRTPRQLPRAGQIEIKMASHSGLIPA
jgi:hypothetical protein